MQNEQALKAALQQRDRNGIREMLDRIGPALYGLALRITESEEKAAVALQATFQKIWKNAAAFDESKTGFFEWVFNLARQSALEVSRESTERNDPFDFLAYQDSHAPGPGLRGVLKNMEEKHRKMVEYACFYGMSEQEIEQKMGIPVGTVSTRLRLALKELRQFFDENKASKV